MFPSIKRNFEKREAWIKLLKRVTADNKEWKPCGNDRVCSEHFVDGIPTVENPNPTLKLGYELKQNQGELYLESLSLKSLKRYQQAAFQLSLPIIQPLLYQVQPFISSPPSPSLSCPDFSSPVSEHCYCTRSNPINCESCDYKDVLINSYKKKLEQLARQNRLLKRAKLLMKSKHISFSWAFTKADKNELLYWSIIN